MWSKNKDKTTNCNIWHILFDSCHFPDIFQTGHSRGDDVILFQKDVFLYLFLWKKYIIRFLYDFKWEYIPTTQYTNTLAIGICFIFSKCRPCKDRAEVTQSAPLPTIWNFKG